MTPSELHLHLAEKMWDGYETGVPWKELDDYGKNRYMHHASVALDAISAAGFAIIPARNADDAVSIAALAFIEHTHGKQPDGFRPGERLLEKMRFVLTAAFPCAMARRT